MRRRLEQEAAERSQQLRAGAQSQAARATAAVARLAHELQVHQIELEMQNEELRQAQVELEKARDRYIDLYDFAPVGYFTLASDGRISEANLTLAALLGVDRTRLVGRRFDRHMTAADRERWNRYAAALLGQPDPGRIELALQARDKRRIEVQLDGVRVEVEGAAPTLRLTLTDISERRRSEAELRIAAAAFETQEGIMITDERGVIERVNRAFTEITGYSAAEAIGHTGRLLRSGRQDAAFYAAMWDSLHRSGAWQGEIWNRRKTGEVYAEWLSITAVNDERSGVVRYVATMTDISLRKAREEQIAQLAFHDVLTGLPNRRLMKDRLHQAMAVSARTQREGALLLVDLDRFKLVNDTLGHDKGDELLCQTARRLTDCVREGDTVARLGGDEFVVMLAADLSEAPAEAAAQAKATAEKILATLSRPYTIAGQEWRSSASIGIALFRNHEFSADDLLQRADQAMYEAKAQGRNTLCFFDAAIQRSLQLRATTEAELRGAVQRGEFVLHYQPGFDRHGRLLGAEALVRWQHPARGLVPPDEFIAIAEDNGLIEAIGTWVLETACAQLAAWSADPDLARLTLSVNISARQLRDRRFVQQVLDALARSGADPARLVLELTESMMLDDVDASIAKMKALKDRRVGFSLDDFGTGYASLSHLKRLPLDQLKIDRSFVGGILIHPHDARIARTVVDLGRSLGLIVIAEGVETAAQRDLLASYGCQVFQGNLFAAAAPADGLREMARRPTPRVATGGATAAAPAGG